MFLPSHGGGPALPLVTPRLAVHARCDLLVTAWFFYLSTYLSSIMIGDPIDGAAVADACAPPHVRRQFNKEGLTPRYAGMVEDVGVKKGRGKGKPKAKV